MRLPPDHPQRLELNNEVHARPSGMLSPPARLSYIVLLTPPSEREAQSHAVGKLASRFGASPPEPGASHFSGEFGTFRVRWERHTEFVRYTFTVDSAEQDPFAGQAIDAVPADWIAALPGQLIVATHAALIRSDQAPDPASLSQRLFAGHLLVGSSIAGGAATAVTDLRIHHDGFGRLLIHDHGLAPQEAGLMVQRLLEIETYRVMALLTLPVARDLTPLLAEAEADLAEIATALVETDDANEPGLLHRLTHLSAAIESREARTQFRFSAARAYHALVTRRISELRETRVPGLQTFQEFNDRRLAPAMNTCNASSARQESLAIRVARAAQLLSTRVDLTREQQNAAVLESMNKRAKLQLRLQSTVEGLSVVAITYYVVALINDLARGLKAAGVIEFDTDLITGLSIPVLILVTGFALHHVRKSIGGRELAAEHEA